MSDDGEVNRRFALIREKDGKVHMVRSRHSPSKEDMRVPVQAVGKPGNSYMIATTAGNAHEPTNHNELVKVSGAVSEVKSLAKDRNVLICSADPPDSLRTCSSQATGDIIAVLDGGLFADKHSRLAADVVGEDARSVPCEVHSNGSRSHAITALSLGAEDAHKIALPAHIRELQSLKEV